MKPHRESHLHIPVSHFWSSFRLNLYCSRFALISLLESTFSSHELINDFISKLQFQTFHFPAFLFHNSNDLKTMPRYNYIIIPLFEFITAAELFTVFTVNDKLLSICSGPNTLSTKWGMVTKSCEITKGCVARIIFSLHISCFPQRRCLQYKTVL